MCLCLNDVVLHFFQGFYDQVRADREEGAVDEDYAALEEFMFGNQGGPPPTGTFIVQDGNVRAMNPFEHEEMMNAFGHQRSFVVCFSSVVSDLR